MKFPNPLNAIAYIQCQSNLFSDPVIIAIRKIHYSRPSSLKALLPLLSTAVSNRVFTGKIYYFCIRKNTVFTWENYPFLTGMITSEISLKPFAVADLAHFWRLSLSQTQLEQNGAKAIFTVQIRIWKALKCYCYEKDYWKKIKWWRSYLHLGRVIFTFLPNLRKFFYFWIKSKL